MVKHGRTLSCLTGQYPLQLPLEGPVEDSGEQGIQQLAGGLLDSARALVVGGIPKLPSEDLLHRVGWRFGNFNGW